MSVLYAETTRNASSRGELLILHLLQVIASLVACRLNANLYEYTKKWTSITECLRQMFLTSVFKLQNLWKSVLAIDNEES